MPLDSGLYADLLRKEGASDPEDRAYATNVACLPHCSLAWGSLAPVEALCVIRLTIGISLT